MARGSPDPDNEALAAWLESEALRRGATGPAAFRARAYRRAAAQVALWPVSVARLVRRAQAQSIPGIGPSIAAALAAALQSPPPAGIPRGWAGRGKATRRGQPAPTTAALRPTRAGITLRGDLHAHTNATDGRDSILAMAQAAKRLGYEYLAITDHTQETRIAGGLDPARMRLHVARIRRVQDLVDGLVLLAGAEVDILRDGRLDLPAALLKDLDVVVCSVHFRHKLTGPQQTQRILKGMSHPAADVLGHPSTRRLGLRGPLELSWPSLFDAAKDQGWAMEVNGSPERLDLDPVQAKEAARRGVHLSLDSDAHSTRELGNVRHALEVAEAAGLRPANVLNTLSLAQLRKRLH